MPNVNRFSDPNNLNQKFMFKLKDIKIDNLDLQNCSIMLSPSVDLVNKKLNLMLRIIDSDGKTITYAAGYLESLLPIDISDPVDANSLTDYYQYESTPLVYCFLDCGMRFDEYYLRFYLTPRGSRPYVGTGYHFGAFLYDKDGKLLTYNGGIQGKFGNSSLKSPIDITI